MYFWTYFFLTYLWILFLSLIFIQQFFRWLYFSFLFLWIFFSNFFVFFVRVKFNGEYIHKMSVIVLGLGKVLLESMKIHYWLSKSIIWPKLCIMQSSSDMKSHRWKKIKILHFFLKCDLFILLNKNYSNFHLFFF